MKYIIILLVFISCNVSSKTHPESTPSHFNWKINLSEANKAKATDLIKITKVTALEWSDECILSGSVGQYEIDPTGKLLGILDNHYNDKFLLFQLDDGSYHGTIDIETNIRERFIDQISGFEFVDDQIYIFNGSKSQFIRFSNQGELMHANRVNFDASSFEWNKKSKTFVFESDQQMAKKCHEIYYYNQNLKLDTLSVRPCLPSLDDYSNSRLQAFDSGNVYFLPDMGNLIYKLDSTHWSTISLVFDDKALNQRFVELNNQIDISTIELDRYFDLLNSPDYPTFKFFELDHYDLLVINYRGYLYWSFRNKASNDDIQTYMLDINSVKLLSPILSPHLVHSDQLIFCNVGDIYERALKYLNENDSDKGYDIIKEELGTSELLNHVIIWASIIEPLKE